MRVLLDEAVPTQLLEPLQHLTKGRHDIAHVVNTQLKGKKDVPLLRMAVELGFDAIVTNDIAQLADPTETKAIAKSKLHHIRYSQRQLGLRGLALALGALVAELPTILDELSSITSQRLVRVQGLDPKKRRFDIIDPSSDPPAYWPRRRARP